MGKDDYAAATGGTLKLKGVQNSKIEKHKKRRKRPNPAEEDHKTSGRDKSPTNEDGKLEGEVQEENSKENRIEKALAEELSKDDEFHNEEAQAQGARKTEAERRHEERRRKRLDERLKREGIKTHKERVEELNRYLSNLSEHHDMPRIGPG